MRNAAFSLIELLIVCAILLLLSALAIPRLSFFDQSLVESELDTLFMTFSFLQQKAIATNQIQKLTFDETAHCYRYAGHGATARTYQLPPQVRFGFPPGAKGPPAHPRERISQAITFPKKLVEFHPNGVISAGTAYLTNRTHSCGVGLTTSIAQVTYVRKYMWNATQWSVR